MPLREFELEPYRRAIKEALRQGRLSEKDLDNALDDFLRVKFRLGLFEKPYIVELPESERFLLEDSRKLARAFAAETFVLLKNEGDILPLSSDRRTVALLGPMADNREDLMGSWNGQGDAGDVVTIREGLEASGMSVKYFGGCPFDGDDRSGFTRAKAIAAGSDVVVVCLGEKKGWSGENASRSTVALPLIQEKLLEAVKTVGKPVVVLLSNGRALDLTRIAPVADAVLEIWQPGVRAGQAVAGILTGKYNPSGKLPVTFPYTTGQIPIYYNHRNSGRRGTQGLYQDIQSTPMYEFGYGLSYTDFEYGPLTVSVMEADDAGAGVSSSASPEAASSSTSLSGTVSSESSSSGAASFVTSSDGTGEDNVLHFTREQKLTATVTVTNTGDRDGKEVVQVVKCTVRNTGERDGAEVVQLYLTDEVSSVQTPPLRLRGFRRVELKRGESRELTFRLTREDLSIHGRDMTFRLEPGRFSVSVGGSSASRPLSGSFVVE